MAEKDTQKNSNPFIKLFLSLEKNSLIEWYDKSTKIIVGTGLIKHVLV